MRVAYVSHSLVADRQAAFAQALRAHAEVSEVFPVRWGKLERKGGWPVTAAGDMVNYAFPREAWDALTAWKPDVLLLQQEAYCRVSGDAARWCRDNRVPLVTFSWENAAPPEPHAVAVLNRASLNVYGNTDAMRLARLADVQAPEAVLPQVGLDPHFFRPPPSDLRYDVGFFGREGDPMKGEAVLDKAAEGQGWRVFKKYRWGFFPYVELAQKYAHNVLQVVPSRDVPGRPREQFCPAVSVEGLLCAVPVVTTNQPAVAEWTREGPYIKAPCPAAWWAEQGDAVSLRAHINAALLEWMNGTEKYREKALAGRAWAVEHFSNERVASEYAKVLRQAVEAGA